MDKNNEQIVFCNVSKYPDFESIQRIGIKKEKQFQNKYDFSFGSRTIHFKRQALNCHSNKGFDTGLKKRQQYNIFERQKAVL